MTLDERIEAYVTRVLETAPPLTEDQRARIAALFAATPERAARRLRAAA